MEVRLASHSDFITPSLACVKPVQIDKAKANRVLHLEGLQDDDAEAAKPPVAKVTLNDCLACAGCITSAESVLVTQQSIGEFERMLSAPGAYDLIVVSVSAAARAAIAAHTGLGLREAHSRMTGFLRGVGCHTVLDCGTASNLGLVQQAAEFVERYRTSALGVGGTLASGGSIASPTAVDSTSASAAVGTAPSASAAATRPSKLPVLSSSCPGWVCYAEKVCGVSVLHHLSRVKSPQQIAGTLIKYAHAAEVAVPPERVCHVTIMPCFDKKLEAARDDFFNPSAGAHGCRDVDCVLSSGELVQMVSERGHPSLAAVPAAPPDTAPPFSALAPAADGPRIAYAAAGASGGHADYIYRYAAHELFGVSLPFEEPLLWKQGRNADISELSYISDVSDMISTDVPDQFAIYLAALRDHHRHR